MFTLTQEQLTAIERDTRDKWAEGAATALFDSYTTYYTAFGASAQTLTPMVQTVITWARRFDIAGKADCTRLCHVTAAWGHRFWQDPRFQGYVTASLSSQVPAGRRATVLTKKTKGWLRALWSEDSMTAFAERLATAITQHQDVDANNIARILPGHVRMFSAPDHERLLATLLQSAPENVNGTPSQRLAYVACALVHGWYWLNDPQYPRLADAVQTRSDPTDLATTITDLYAEASA